MGGFLYEGKTMKLIKITMPTTADDKLVDWEDCVQAYREKKRKWLRKQEMQCKKM